ncbi:PilC/PilY family type IV pilus protein [Variovorax ureilyticus]|uniref:PilC/PilY family type IV pilus protein n=1 Tax=Variovorax ureilyticus TaxID=1836198 RepID=A0ABU8V9H8_9BURK
MNSLAFRLFLAILAALVLHSRAAAEDIDLYAGSGAGGAPNVLFYLDNSSNWSNNAQAWSYSTVYGKCTTNYSGSTRTTCQSYVNQVFCGSTSACSGNPSLVQGQVEVRALKLVLNQLVCSPPSGTPALDINAGLMMFNTSVGSVDGPSVMPGYIRHEIKPLSVQCTDTNVATSILADLTNIDTKITTPDFKGASSAEYGAGLYEAFKYFGGWSRPDLVVSGSGGTAGSPTGATGFGPTRYSTATSLEDVNAFTDASKTTYKSPITGANTCGKNFIILIGNTWPNQEYGTNTNSSPNPTNTLMSRLGYNPGPQIYPVPLPNSQKSNVRFADEWAGFLYSTDVSSMDGQQNVQTFTIDVYNQSQDAKQAKLLQTMAAVGRGQAPDNYAGGYYSVGGDLLALINALKETLTQIASVNSVFASASLPVSVNAQGTYLNQVFMGVFRPQENAYQRWAGNMKQYQFALNGNSLYLADATKAPAVDTSSGFILNCAASFWSHDSGTYWQSVTGTASSCGSDTYSSYSKFSDLPDGPLVERGASGQKLRDLGYAARNIRTCTDTTCSSVVDFNTTNVTIPSTGLSKGTTSANLVNWARGQNVGDGNNTFDSSNGNLVTTTYSTTDSAGATVAGPTTRPTVHGEVVHSRPLAVNYGSGSTNDVVVFYGAGDGMLHAVSGNQTGTGAGNELWAFIAPEHWSGTDSTNSWNLLDRVHSNYPLISFPGVTATGAAPKTYFFDGSIGGYQEVSGGALSKLWIYPTMRRGGRAIYAFDASRKPGTGGNQPTLMWKFSSTDSSSLGQTWSTPVAIRVKIGTATNTLVAFGAGYDSCEDGIATACDTVTQGRGIFVMDAANGKTANYRFFDPGTTAGRFVADLTAVDVNGDGIVDLLYAVDTRGNIWRINTSDPNNGYSSYATIASWPINKIATVSDWSIASEQRKFMYAPSVVMLGKQATILVGTGDREKPLASGAAASVNNRFYGIRDDITKTGATVSTTPTVVNGYGSDASLAIANQLTNVTNVTTTLDPTALAAKGWYMNLYTTSTPYEQVVTAPLTIGGQTYFSTFQPKSSTTSSNQCSNLGTGRAYAVDFQTGVMTPNSNGVYAPNTFSSQGIPPSPVGGLVSIDGKTVPFCIGCSGPTVLSPNKITPKVKPDRKPVYRFQKIDS